MDKYISQLIGDIEKLLDQKFENPSEFWDNFDLNIAYKISEMLNTEENEHVNKLELQQIVGIQKLALPPSNRLTDSQISILLPHLVALLENYHFQLDYPHNIDSRTLYEMLYKIWDVDHTKVNFGVVDIEFCDYDVQNCPVPGKCKACKEILLKQEQGIKSKAVESDPTNLTSANEQMDMFLKEQKVEKVRKILENIKPFIGNIPGIFNYCNRWCEKCMFTNKCTNFQFEKELGFSSNNLENEKTPENAVDVLSKTLSILKSKIDEFDNDLLQFQVELEIDIRKASKHKLSVLAKNYMDDASNWFDVNFDYLSHIGSYLLNKSPKDYKQFRKHIQTICWYITLIPEKIVHAVNPKLAENNFVFFEFDSHATAKLLLVSIDESIYALICLYEKLSKKRDQILDLLSLLSQIKNGLEKEFPAARNFVRPGLDE